MREAKYTKPLSTAYSEETYNRIREIATEQRISMADVVRKLIDEALRAGKENHLTDNSTEGEALWKLVQGNDS